MTLDGVTLNEDEGDGFKYAPAPTSSSIWNLEHGIQPE
jgi:hypothetical protein